MNGKRNCSLTHLVGSVFGLPGDYRGFRRIMWVSVSRPPTQPLSAKMCKPEPMLKSGEGGGELNKVVFSM